MASQPSHEPYGKRTQQPTTTVIAPPSYPFAAAIYVWYNHTIVCTLSIVLLPVVIHPPSPFALSPSFHFFPFRFFSLFFPCSGPSLLPSSFPLSSPFHPHLNSHLRLPLHLATSALCPLPPSLITPSSSHAHSLQPHHPYFLLHFFTYFFFTLRLCTFFVSSPLFFSAQLEQRLKNTTFFSHTGNQLICFLSLITSFFHSSLVALLFFQRKRSNNEEKKNAEREGGGGWR